MLSLGEKMDRIANRRAKVTDEICPEQDSSQEPFQPF